MVKRLIILVSLVLIVAHLFPESGELLEHLNKFINKHITNIGDINKIYINPFWDKSYVFPVHPGEPAGIKLTWWLFYWGNDFLLVATYFVATKIALQLSFKLFMIFGLYFIYHFLDHLMLWYNFKSTHEFYWVAHAINISCILILIFKKEKKTGILKSFD